MNENLLKDTGETIALSKWLAAAAAVKLLKTQGEDQPVVNGFL